MSRAKDLIDRFGREEDAFLRSELVAPVIGSGRVRVRLAGIVCELAVTNSTEGWQVLRPRSHREAEVAREATRSEIRSYLHLFPRARLVAAHRLGETWMGLPAATPQKGVVVEGLVPIALAKDLQLFQTVVVRFDGALFLPETMERSAAAASLRDELARATPAEEIQRKGLLQAEREAYALQLALKLKEAKSESERRLERALEIAGAKLERFENRRDAWRVRFTVDGREYTSVVSQRDLTVVSAGVCLSGRDAEFDLTSLVSVLKERSRRGIEEDE